MEKITVRRAAATSHTGCFGNFRFEDAVCRKHCAIRIRCTIERDAKMMLEFVDEMDAGGDEFFLKFR
ncbi:MAG: hypothetical protein E4H48_04235 [Syntrophobacterales bacterium]|nr:MAG: hypothetical protein E4H48_04235 [Syntrophobacterales bacterium]